MNGLECRSCGEALEAGDQFCGACGRPVGGLTVATAMPPPVLAPPPIYGGPMYYRPPRNPRQIAAIAAGVMVIICGMFALFVGNVLFNDAWDWEWDPVTGEDYRVLDPLPFAVGVLFIAATGLSLLGAYFSFRTSRFVLALTGPLSLLVAYFSSIVYEPEIMIFMVHMMIMSIVSLGLLSYARPGFVAAGGPTVPYAHLGPDTQAGGGT